MKKYLYVHFNIGTCWIHYEEKKTPWVQTFFWSSAIARMEWNGMTDIIPIIDPLSDRTGTATAPECKWVLSEWWVEWLYVPTMLHRRHNKPDMLQWTYMYQGVTGYNVVNYYMHKTKTVYTPQLWNRA